MSDNARTITIPAPIAQPGCRVEVLNYRRRPPQWERGEMSEMSYHVFGAKGQWHYSVTLDRMSHGGTFLHVTARDSEVREETFDE